MALQRCTAEGKDGWRWGKDGTCFVGDNAMKDALNVGALEDPEVFANIAYEVVTASSDVRWGQLPDGAEVLHLD